MTTKTQKRTRISDYDSSAQHRDKQMTVCFGITLDFLFTCDFETIIATSCTLFENACARISWILIMAHHKRRNVESNWITSWSHIEDKLYIFSQYSIDRFKPCRRAARTFIANINAWSVLTCSFFAHACASILTLISFHFISHSEYSTDVCRLYCHLMPNDMFAVSDVVAAALRRAYASKRLIVHYIRSIVFNCLFHTHFVWSKNRVKSTAIWMTAIFDEGKNWILEYANE